MASSIPRPIPIGTNSRGTPTWNGIEVCAFRIAHGVTQGELARAMGMSQSAVNTLFEVEHAPIPASYDRIEAYCQAVERIHKRRDERAAAALADLKNRTFAEPKEHGHWRSSAEAAAILAAQARGER